MKIGIITFHWGTNYGAILQAYSLQTYLQNRGNDVEIINYRPKNLKKTLIKCFLTPKFYRYFFNVKTLIKEKKLKKFRDKYLNETILYESLKELKANPPIFDVYICGSDQVWNPSFTTLGEGKETSTYFLDFGPSNIKRVAYAVSFGCEKYPILASNIAKKFISNFNLLSVREDSGKNILSTLGVLDCLRLVDPTLLLNSEDYSFDNSINQVTIHKNAFFYFLRNEKKIANKIEAYLKKDFVITSSEKFLNPYDVQDWVLAIKNASLVMTNSFHGMVFSLIFHVPFIVIAAKGKAASMNDRFITLLSELGLMNRIISNYDKEKMDLLINTKIDWIKIDLKISRLKEESNKFFQKVSC